MTWAMPQCAKLVCMRVVRRTFLVRRGTDASVCAGEWSPHLMKCMTNLSAKLYYFIVLYEFFIGVKLADVFAILNLDIKK
jgi:hypothetical protein